jgi:hypothetical protein
MGVALLGAATCSPKNDVKPGAPILFMLSIVTPDGARTDVKPDTTDCPPGISDGGDCDPSSVGVCRNADTPDGGAPMTSICHCDAKAMDDPSIMPEDPNTTGSATCSYDPRSTVIAVFDRLLDTTPFDPAGKKGLATLTSNSTVATGADVSGDYNPAGLPDAGLVFPLFFSIYGPSLTFSGNPALPAGAAVTLTLKGDQIRAKDGKTPFASAGGPLGAGAITFQTQGLAATITTPEMPSDGDGGTLPVPPMMQPVTVTFNNPVDPATVKITATSNGTAIPTADLTVDASMAPTFTVTPTTAWPANATIVITVAGGATGATDVVGDPLAADATATFMTGAM